MNQREEKLARRLDRRVESEQLVLLLRTFLILPTGGEVVAPDSHAPGGKRDPQTLLAFLQRRLDGPALVDVAERADAPHRPPLTVERHQPGGDDPALLAGVGAADAELGVILARFGIG